MQSLDQQFIDALEEVRELYPGSEKVVHTDGLTIYEWKDSNVSITIVNQHCCIKSSERTRRFRFFADSLPTTIDSVKEDLSHLFSLL